MNIDKYSIIVDTNIMLSKAEEVSSAIRNMEQSFQRIQRLVEGTSRYWAGSAADIHRKMFLGEKNNTDIIIRRLKEHPEELKQMAQNYASAEQSITVQNQRLRNDYI